MYVIAVTNVPPGRFAELTADSEDVALDKAREMSSGLRRLAVTVFEIRSDGAHAFASFLNGEQRFKPP